MAQVVTINTAFLNMQTEIKRIIRYEKAIRQAVKEKRIERRGHRVQSEGRAPLHVSKPTEMAAIENLSALDYVFIQCGSHKAKRRIDNPEGWLNAVSFVRESLSSFDRKFMAEAFRRSDWSVCADFHMSAQKFYALKKEIVMKVAVKAAVDGLITL